jgi:WD40 repeat protein
VVQVWDLTQKGSAPLVGVAHSDEVKQAYFTPDGKQIVSVGQDCCIAVWNFYA